MSSGLPRQGTGCLLGVKKALDDGERLGLTVGWIVTDATHFSNLVGCSQCAILLRESVLFSCMVKAPAVCTYDPSVMRAEGGNVSIYFYLVS